MPKQLNVDLRFSADTSQAKKQIQDLQASLSKLGLDASKSMNFNSMNSELREATNNVNMLKAQLQSAFNVNTGKLDLTKFNQEMQQSGMSIEKYHKSLISLGPDGRKAFTELANAVSQADIPLLKTNKLLTEMGTVLKNTIKWQISSSAIHGFMGAIQQAYGYAQDLNESLTNIQIVTQHSTDQMAAFAAQANRAAQALSTTTTSYTDAALIFYQQGLDDQAVKERTDATIKMAQVTGDAATEVSSYMTAIWNNFDNGTESLEHYADVITALGAATASSSSEIAEGLSKFASIADTVGLSYEYATSALATVVAQTRQSADVVGTAFKTIFARIQDLEQGATLEDGVDLGQYAKALAKVGVDVLDTNGQLREMDDILDDIGEKWGQLGEAERVALAQNVAGQRQYAQFMAIFENWDTFKTNLGTANASEGMLQEQADIYAESWEASSKRVRAAMEGIYQSIIDDDFFITINDFLSDNLNGVNNLIKALGGLPGLLSVIGTLTTRYFGPQMASVLRDAGQSMMMLTASGRQKIQNSQLEILNKAKGDWVDDSAQSYIQKGKLDIQTTYLQNAEKLTDLQKLAIDYEREQYEILSKEVLEKEEIVKQTEKEIEELTTRQRLMVQNNGGQNSEYVKSKSELFTSVTKINERGLNLEQANQLAVLQEGLMSVKGGKNGYIKAYQEDLKQLMQDFKWTAEAKEEFDKVINRPVINGNQLFAGVQKALDKQGISYKELKKDVSAYNDAITNLTKSLAGNGQDTEKARESAQALADAIFRSVTSTEEFKQSLDVLQTKVGSVNETIKTASLGMNDWADRIVSFSSSLMQISMVVNNLKGMGDVINNDDMSGGEKLLSIMTSLSMVLPILVTGFKNLTITKELMNLTDMKMLNSGELLLKLSKGELTSQEVLNAAKILGIEITEDEEVATVAEAVAKKLETATTWDLVKALIAQQAAELAVYAPLLLIVAVLAAVAGALYVVNQRMQAHTTTSEEAAKSASKMKDILNEAKQAYDNLKSSIEDYTGAKEALDELTVGTLEWKEALVKANEQAFELIRNYHLIQGNDWTFDENGVVQFSEGTFDNILQQQSSRVTQATMASMLATGRSNRAAASEQRADLTTDLFYSRLEQYRTSHNLTSTSDIGGQVQNQIRTQVNAQVAEWLDAYHNGTLDTYTDISDGLRERIEEVGQHWEQAAEIMDTASAAAAHMAMAENEIYNNIEDNDLQDQVGSALQRITENTIAERYDEIYEDAIDRGAFNTGTDASEAVLDAYMEAIQAQNWDVSNYVGDGTIVATYQDQEGVWHEDETIHPEDIANLLSTIDLEEELGQTTQNLITAFESLNNSIDVSDQALASFVSNNNLEGATRDEFNALSENIATNYGGDIQSYLEAQASELGITLNDLASLAGADSAEEFVSSFETSFNDATSGWDSLNSNRFDNFSNITNSLTLESANLLNQKVHELDIGPLGEEAGTQFLESFNEFLEDVSPEDQAAALSRLINIDWSSNDALEQASSILADYGVELDITSERWANFAEQMQRAQGYIPSFEDLRQNLQDVSRILSDLDFGAVISPEDYELLCSYNDEWERFFILQADGSRKFIGNAQQMLNAERSQILQQQQDLNNQRDLANNFNSTWQGYDWSGASSSAGSNDSTRTTLNNLIQADANMGTTHEVLQLLNYDSERLQQILDDLNSTDEQIRATAEESVQSLYEAIGNFVGFNFDEAEQETREAFASTASNYYELITMLSNGDINNEAYQKQSEYLLNTLASVEQLEDAYSAGYIAFEQYQDALEGVTQRQAEALGLEGESVLVQAQEMAEAYRLEAIYGDEAAGVAARLAIQNQLMNKGVSALASNWENWREELETTDYTTQDYADTVVDVTEAIRDLVGITDENFRLSSEFLKAEENLELLGQAAEGSEEAIEQLGVAVARNLVDNLQSVEDSFDFSGLNDSDTEMMHSVFDRFESDRLIVSNGLAELQEQINSLGMGEDVTSILGDDWIDALNRMAIATGMTVDQMNDMLNSMGVEADVTTTTVPTHTSVPWYRTEEKVNETTDGEGRVTGRTTESHVVATGFDTVPGEVEVAQLNTGKNAGTPPSITKIGNGSIAPSTHRSSSGGGDGGKSSQKKKKDPTDEKERYHVINNQLEDNTKLLEQMSKAKDRAYGKSKLSYMDAEIERQRESIALNEEKLRQVEEFLELDQAAIRGFGAEFDANGTITNYDALMQEQIDKYNAAVDAYNNGSMDENAEAVFQQAEDEYNAFTEALKQYEETQDLWYEQYQAVADAKAELLSLQLQKIDYKVQLGVEWEDDDIERLDFLLGRIGDDAYKAAEAIGLLSDKATNALDKYNTYQQGLAETLSAIGVNDASSVLQRAMNGESLVDMAASQIDASTAGEAIEQMGNYISEMMKELEAASESIKEAFEQVKNVFSDSINQMDKYEEKIKHIQNVTKSYRNIIDIVGKDSLGVSNEILREMNAMTVQQTTNAESAAKAEMDMVRSQLSETEARLAQATTDEERAYWQDLINEQEDALITATENFHQAWEDALQANLEAFEQNIELVMDSFSKAIGNVESLKYQFDMQKSVKDLYEPDYESWYQLSNLVEDIDKTLANGEALRYQQDLLDLEQEIVGLQEEGAKLSEYDLEYLRLRYESKLALAQLDEAENAKSQVRMSRDNEGNYSYVYTADEDAVADAENNYRQKLYEMEKANQEYIDNLQVQLLELNDQMLEEISRAREIYGNDTVALEQAIEQIHEEYRQKGAFIEEQMGHVFENNTRLREEDMVSYYEYTGDVYAANVDLTENFSETFLAIQTGTETLQEYFEGTWFPALDNTFVNINDVLNEFRENEDNIMREAGTSMEDFANDASDAMQEVTDETNVLTDATKKYGEEAARRFAEAAQAWQNGPAQMISTINAQADAIAALAQQYIALKSAIEAAAAAARSMPGSSGSTAYTPNSYTPSSPGGGGGGKGTLGGNTPSTPPPAGLDRQFQALLALHNPSQGKYNQDALRQIRELQERYPGYFLTSFDSGGYTGAWGSDGRWAMLHEKELVLNADDTKNFLAAVDIVRSLASSIDLKAMTANTSGINLATPSSYGEILEQKVEVTANFPNVTDRNEIEEAFGNIINLASQYANRKQ